MNEEQEKNPWTVIFTADEIAAIVHQLAREISAGYRQKQTDEPLLIVGILAGALVFMADLIREMTIPVELDFLRLSSYGTAHVSSGHVRLLSEPVKPLAGRHVLLLDDMIDSGRTLAFARQYLLDHGAVDVEIVVLLDKKSPRKEDVFCRYIGAEVENKFLG
ncbi:MAG: hypothetical protein IKW74_02945, partial [Thermoguttaceae bacterium]|nr:hypothetical protein [Thermoguttaceae bacterium]